MLLQRDLNAARLFLSVLFVLEWLNGFFTRGASPVVRYKATPFT